MEYADKLAALRLNVVVHGSWASVGRTKREQGWKLHLSTVPTQAHALLDTVLPALSQSGVSFKVARGEGTLRQLNEGALGATQVGKFLTIFPRTNKEAQSLAARLIRLTKGFDGPVIITDLRLGDIVYARYGPFSPPAIRDRLGNISLGFRLPDGKLIPHQYAVPFEPPRGRVNPFRDFDDFSGEPISRVQTGMLLGPGYLLLEVIEPKPRGSVFLGLDARAEAGGPSLCVIKEGRKHCCSDSLGRDMRTRLRRQAAVLAQVKRTVSVPTPAPYFEFAGNGYLPMEYVEGHDLAHEVGTPFGSLEQNQQSHLLSHLVQVTRILITLHRAGYLHRDVKPSNFRVTPDDKIVTIDLELAHAIGSHEPPFGKGTPGFMSPQQQAEDSPAVTDDVYGFGATAAFLLTGIHPLQAAGEQVTGGQLAGLSDAPSILTDIIAECVSERPEARPSLDAIETALESAQCGPGQANRRSPKRQQQTARPGSDDLLAAAVQGLLASVVMDDETGLWTSETMSQAKSQSAPTEYRLYRSANRGVAGVIYTLARLARYGYLPDSARPRVGQAVDWLLAHAPTPDDQLPGLHFGEAGVAVALAEAVGAGLISEGTWFREYLGAALYGPLDWPDLTHGAAGQGIAALCCAQALTRPDLLGAADRCADFLVASQDDDGSWTMPPGVEGMSGSRLTGFAHGAAGIVYFLCEYAARSGRPEAALAAREGANWLLAQARMSRIADGLEWPTREGGEDVWRWWCHGAPGIALAWLKLFEHCGNADDRQIAIRALRSRPSEVRNTNLSQCHGLTGLGEIYLEATRILSDERWRSRADCIADTLIRLARTTNQGKVWLVEGGPSPTGDLMVGCAGIVHFLLRMSEDVQLSFPLLP
jgi:serine/threonine protein kinase